MTPYALLVAFSAQAVALRPQSGSASISVNIARIGDLVSRGSLSSLRAAAGIVESVLAETGNATDHMSDADAELLRSVITLVETTIYGSMDQAQAADISTLDEGVAAATQCNTDIANRQSPTGDLGIMEQSVTDHQTELDRLQGIVDEKTLANNSAWDAFDLHMQLISTPPSCPGLPARNMPALDGYFEKSDYSIWFAAQQAAYQSENGLFTDADEALTAAINEYNIQEAVRDTQFCDWKTELEAACTSFDTCFSEKTSTYENELVPRVTGDKSARIETYKAGETLVHQIKFLLGDVDTQETPAIDVGRYEFPTPSLPAKGLCDLTVLDDAKWVPTPSCDDASGPGKP